MPKKINIQKLKELEASGAIDAKAAETLREMSNKGYNVEIDESGDYKFVDKYGLQSTKRVGTRAGLLRGANKRRRNVSDAVARANQAGVFEDIKVELAPKSTSTVEGASTGTETGTGAGTKKKDAAVTLVDDPPVVAPTETEAQKAARLEAERLAAEEKRKQEENARIAKLTQTRGTKENEAATIKAVTDATGKEFMIKDGVLQLVASDPATPPPGTINTPHYSIMGDENFSTLVSKPQATQPTSNVSDKNNQESMLVLDNFSRAKRGQINSPIQDLEGIKIARLSPQASNASITDEYNSYINQLLDLDVIPDRNYSSLFGYTPLTLEQFTEFIKSGKGLSTPQPLTTDIINTYPDPVGGLFKWIGGQGEGMNKRNREFYQRTATKRSGGRLTPKAQGGVYAPIDWNNPFPNTADMRSIPSLPNYEIPQVSYAPMANSPFDSMSTPNYSSNTALAPKAVTVAPSAVTPGDEGKAKPSGNETDDPSADKLWKTPFGDVDPRELARMGVYTALTARPKLTGMTYGELQNAPLLEGMREEGLTKETSQMFDRQAARLQSQGADVAAQYSDPLLGMQGKLTANKLANDMLIQKAVANEEALTGQQNKNIDTRNANRTAADVREKEKLARRDQQTAANVELANQEEGVKNTLRNTFRTSLDNLFKDSKSNSMVADINTSTYALSVAQSALDAAESLPKGTKAEIYARNEAIRKAREKMAQANTAIAQSQGVDVKHVLKNYGTE